MTSPTGTISAPTTVPGLVRAADQLVEAARTVRAALAADPALLAEVPDDLLVQLTLDLHGAVDAATSAATVVTGRLERVVGSVRGKLVAGSYPSTTRFLERECGMSGAQARATVARGRDLDTHSTRVADAWLAGKIPGGAVRDLTVGVTDVLRRSTRTDTPVARDGALDHLLPIAASGDTRRLHLATAEMRLRIDPDGTTEEALFAFEQQSLSIVDAGSMFRISGWLPPETAVAARTVLEAASRRLVEEQLGEVAHDDDCEAVLDQGSDCSCGEVDRARRTAGLRHDHVLARAFGEVMTDRLDDAELGSHHRVAPHITVVVDATDVGGPLIGRMAVPGSDDEVLVGEESVHRLLCDADVTRVLTTNAAGTGSDSGNGFLAAVVTTLEAMARSVLYVGRSERTVSARLRRALEIRDGHCVFPGCRASVARCHAHHVVPWQHRGRTDLSNMALLCVAHHHAVHEGGWTMSLRRGANGHEQGCWTFTPPPLRGRRTRP